MNSTKFFLYMDYQLVYCPITFILALAFTVNAFEADRITPDNIMQLKGPKADVLNGS